MRKLSKCLIAQMGKISHLQYNVNKYGYPPSGIKITVFAIGTRLRHVDDKAS